VQLHGDRQVHVFLDRVRLQAGRRFDKDFLEALFMSTVVVPVVSMGALERMMTLKEDSDVDNVLLEWTLICELFEVGLLEYCLPILIGKVLEDSGPDGKFITNLFAEGAIEKLPDVVCENVVSTVRKFLEDNGKTPSAQLQSRTVRGVVKTITKFLGVQTWEIKSRHTAGGGGGTTSLVHSRVEWKQSVLAEVVNQAIKCVDRAGAEGKSKVRHESQEPALAGTAVPSGAGTAVPSGGSVVTEWSEQDVATYVSGLEEFGAHAIEYAAKMSAEHIDGKAFVLLTAEELKELGFSMGHRKNLLAHIEQLRAPAAASAGASHAPEAAALPEPEGISRAQQEKEFEDAQEIGEVDGAHQVWESMDAERVEECLQAAMRAGGKALNTSRLNIVGEGRAGKTAWLRAVSNQAWKEVHMMM
jgi:hypothetical protein